MILFWKLVRVSLSAVFCTSFAFGISNDDFLVLCRNARGGSGAAKALEAAISSKTEAIAFLRELKVLHSYQVGEYVLGESQAPLLLANLGDRQAMQEIYQVFLAKKSEPGGVFFMQVVSNISHPDFIAILGQGLGNRENGAYFQGTFPKYPAPYANAHAILNIVARSGYFAPETAEWARNTVMRFSPSPDQPGTMIEADANPHTFLPATRAFWEANQEKLKGRQYGLVRPPGVAASPPNLDASSTRALELKPKPTSAPAKAIAQTAPATAPRTESPPVALPWLWIALGVAVVVTLFFVLRPKQ